MHKLSKAKLQESALTITKENVGSRTHISRFMYALKSRETRRQYPQRLKVFLDFLDPSGGILDEQALQFLDKVRQDPRWFEDRFMDFIGFQLARVSRGDISESTIPNYYIKITATIVNPNNLNNGLLRLRDLSLSFIVQYV